MARHAENCSGEVEDAENGAPTPKKGRRGRKRKMRSRRDDDDSGENVMFKNCVYYPFPTSTNLVLVLG